LVLIGEGEGRRLTLEGEAEARVQERKIASFGDPRLYALAQVAHRLSESKQPLVPERLLISGGADGKSGQNLVGTLLSLMVAEKSVANRTFFTDTNGLVLTSGSATALGETADFSSYGAMVASCTIHRISLGGG